MRCRLAPQRQWRAIGSPTTPPRACIPTGRSYLLAAGCFVDHYVVTAMLLLRRVGLRRLLEMVFAQLSLFLVVGIAFLSIT